MPVFKNDGLEVLAFMLDVEQDIIWQIGVCLNDEERRRAQGLGPPPLRCCPRAAAPGPRFQTGNFAVRRRTRVWAAGQPPALAPHACERFALQLFTIRRCGGHSSRPGKRSEWTSRQFFLRPKRTRSQRSAFPPPSTSPTPPLVRNTGWKASSSAGAGWRLSARPWGAAWDRAGPAKWRSIEYRRPACRRRRSTATFPGGSNSDEIYLRDNRRLATQLQGLERRIARGGQGQHRSAPGSKGDSANAAEHKTDWDPGTQRARWWASPSLRG